jgi:hypothetical protein
MPSKFAQLYRFTDKTKLDPGTFNPRFADVDARLVSLEDLYPDWETAVAQLEQIGLQRINEVLGPNLDRIQQAASLGFLSAHVADNFSISFAPVASTAIPLLADARRDLFTPAPFVALVRTTDVNSYAVCRTIGYDKTLGVLTVQILSNSGPVGPFTDVEVWALAGTALILQGQTSALQNSANAAAASATAAAGSAAAAESSRGGAQAAQSAAETARAQAETARTQAQAAAAGVGVKVTTTDTTPAALGTKVTTVGAVKATVTNPTGDARLQLSVNGADTVNPGLVRFATTTEATTGTDTGSAVTPAGLKAAINAIPATGGTGTATAPAGLPYMSKTAAYTLVAGDNGKFVDLTGTFTLAFTASATLGANWYCWLRNIGTGDITLDPAGTELIDGLGSYPLYPTECRLVWGDGVQLRTMVINPYRKIWSGAGDYTFVRTPGYSDFDVYLLGAGGGGAGGGSRSSNPWDNIWGGAGGGGGALKYRRIPSSQMGATETIHLNAGGAGGLGVAPGGSTVGNGGGWPSGNATFGAHLACEGGRGGSGNHDANTASNGFSVGAGSRRAVPPATDAGGLIVTDINGAGLVIPLTGGGGGGRATMDDIASGYPGGRSEQGGPGGGGGGPMVTPGAFSATGVRPGGAGGTRSDGELPVGGGPTAGAASSTATGGAGGSDTTPADQLVGRGGGGGGSGLSAGGYGGNGGRGAGGGGGGAGYNGKGGNGGKGGDAACLVMGVL